MAFPHAGMILQPTYRVRSGRPVVQLYGRLVGGGGFLVEDDRFRPYFFLRERELDLLPREQGVSVEETGLRDFSGELVARVEVPVPGAVPPLRDRLIARGATPLEADIRFPYRFLIDHGIRASLEIEGKGRRRGNLLAFRNPELRPSDARPDLRVLSIDIETTPDASQVISVALVGCGVDEVHLLQRRAVKGAFVHESEHALLRTAGERVRDLDPDVLTGWNVVDFDLRVWVRRCEALRLHPGLGRLPGDVFFQRDSSFTRQSRADVPGRQVLDAGSLVRDAVRLEDYRLETAARALLGRGKLIDHDAPDASLEIQRLHREEPEALVAYNREDARLVLDILEQEGLLELAVERSLLSGMQLDRVGASIASFDLLYLPELRRRGLVAPSVNRERQIGPTVKGGAVLDSEPGLFRQVAVYDFKSLYPSLIRTFNLDPLAHQRANGSSVEAPNGARFSRDEALLPGIIERFMKRREEAKARGHHHADQAIKIMMNALFGVLGSPGCRFFDPDIANAITGFGQQTLLWTREAFEKEGVRVIYGDTDSVFVKLAAEGSSPEARREAEALRVRVSAAIEQRIRDAYDVEPGLELELERIYERFFMPSVRGGKSGSKKRYAGWDAGALEIVGLEAVRRDWPQVARRLQRGMLERVFTDADVVPFVKEIVAGVRGGDLDAELVYIKRLRKRSEGYTKTTPPHVQAARKAGAAPGSVVRYVITATGPEPAPPGRPLPPGIDHAHYVEKVLRPIADAILPVLGHDFDEVLGAPKQLELL